MRRGFTLLEVLVATVIMGIAVVGVLSALSTSLQNAARLTDADRAALLAGSKMNELLLDPTLPRFTEIQGQWDRAGFGGSQNGWRARVTPFDVPPGAGPGTPVLDRIELEVWWMSGSTRRAFTVEGYRQGILRPEDAAQGAATP